MSDRRNTKQIEYKAPEGSQKHEAQAVVNVHWHLLGFQCPPSVNWILSAIISHANPKDGQCNPSQEVLGRETGYKRRTIVDAINFATDEGFLTTSGQTDIGARLSYQLGIYLVPAQLGVGPVAAGHDVATT